MSEDRLQLSRIELKYQVSEAIALGVRDFVSSYLEIDDFGATKPNLSYSIHSLYLDSPSLATYWHTINGNKNRFKLRLRYYENNPGDPVYFEIKRRANNAILKQRSGIRREAVDRVLRGHLPEPSELSSSDPRHLAAIQRFAALAADLHAVPTAHIHYQREAWISPCDNSLRVTMDRQVLFEPDPTCLLPSGTTRPTCVFGKTVILELKYTGRFPEWWRELIRIYGLTQGSAAKYADGIVLYGEKRLRNVLLAEGGNPVAMEELPVPTAWQTAPSLPAQPAYVLAPS